MKSVKILFLLGCAAVLPLAAENLILGDSSVETEPHTMQCGNLDTGYLPAYWEMNDAAHGKKCIRVDWDRKNRRMILSNAAMDGWVDKRICVDTSELKNNQFYTFSFYAKAEHDNAPMIITLVPNAAWNFWPKGFYNQRTFRLSKQWKRYSMTFKAVISPKAPYKGYSCFFGFNNAKPGKFYIDAVQVNAGKKLLPYTPGKAIDCGIDLKPFDSKEYRATMKYIYYPGDKITGNVRVVSNDGKGGTLTIRAIDHRSKVLFEKKQQVKGGEVIPLKFDSSRRGWFKITAAVTRGKKEMTKHTANFIVIDKPEKLAKGVPPFFAMISHLHFTELMKRVGVKRVQISPHWKKGTTPGIENEPGKFDYRFIDMLVNRAKEYDMQIKLTLAPFRAPKWYFDEATWKEASKYAHGTDSLNTEETLRIWKKIVHTIVKKHGKHINILELGGEDNGILGTGGYYRAKHPEYLIDNWVCRGKIFNMVYDAVSEACRDARKMYPHILTGVVRPSQGREGTNWIYTEKVFERIGKDFTVFPIDTYLMVPYTLSPIVTGHVGTLDGRVYTRDLCNSIINKYGKNQKVFISEAGIQGDTLFPDESRWEVERAELFAKDFFMVRAMGFFSMDHFGGLSSYVTDRFNFALSYHHRLQIGAASTAAAARIVENVVDGEFIKLPGAARLCLFKKADNSGRAALWADKGYIFKPAKGSSFTVYDMMGNRIAPNKKGEYILGLEPVTVSAKNYAAMKKQLERAEIYHTDFCEIRTEVQKADSITIRIDNTSNKKDLRLEIEVKSDINPPKRRLSVAPGTYRLIGFRASGKHADITIRNVENNGVIRKRANLPEVTALKTAPVKFAEVYSQNHLLPNESWTPWSGRKDFSAEFFANWDKNYLYITVKAVDDRHYNKFTHTYNADSLQIAIDPESDAGIRKRTPGLLGRDDVEFGIALSSKNGKLFASNSCGNKAIPAKDDYSIVRDEKAKTTTYKVRIPWKELKVVPTPGKVFGMSLILFDDDTNSGHEYYAPIGGGVAGKKDPTKFLKFKLEK